MLLLKTKRLYFRLFDAEDLNLLNSLHSNPDVAKTTIDGIQSIDVAKKHLDEFIIHQEKFGFSQWAVFEIQSDKFVGRAGLTRRILSKEIGEQIELRFAFLPEFWGLGFASEASKKIVQFSEKKLKLKKIIAASGFANPKSAQVLIKQGFEHTKNIIPDGYVVSEEIKYWELEF